MCPVSTKTNLHLQFTQYIWSLWSGYYIILYIYIYKWYIYISPIYTIQTHTHTYFRVSVLHLAKTHIGWSSFPLVGVLGQQLRSGSLESRQKLTASCFRTYFKEQIQVSTDKQKERYATKIVVTTRTLHSMGWVNDILLSSVFFPLGELAAHRLGFLIWDPNFVLTLSWLIAIVAQIRAFW